MSDDDSKPGVYVNGVRIADLGDPLECDDACACCGHRLAVHSKLRLDAVTGEGPWEPGVCAGDDGEGCSANCLLFEVPGWEPKP